MTTLTLIQHQHLFLQDVSSLLREGARQGFVLTAGEMWRPQEMQDLYFTQGKTRTHSSNHTKRLAVDLNIFRIDAHTLCTLEEIRPLGNFWESLASSFNRWGGNFTTIKDGPHFERNVP